MKEKILLVDDNPTNFWKAGRAHFDEVNVLSMEACRV
jgi:hypothetical protein